MDIKRQTVTWDKFIYGKRNHEPLKTSKTRSTKIVLEVSHN